MDKLRFGLPVLIVTLFTLLMVPFAAMAQGFWTQTINLQDRRDRGELPIVATVTFLAYTMLEPTSPGDPIKLGPNNSVESVNFPDRENGYIKFKISKIDWSPLGKEFDGSADFKVIVRNLWVDMTPRIYAEKGGNIANIRKRYITAQNFEYIKGDSLPPPTIFKVDKNGKYTFSIGVKAVTPKTVEERPFNFDFTFDIKGLKASMVEEAPIVEEPETTVAPPPVVVEPKNTDDIDNAVKIAIENEDVEGLIDLIKRNPDVQSCKDARVYLSLKMTKELVDSLTYRVEISYAKFNRALPTREEIDLSFATKDGAVGDNIVNPQWRDGQLYLRPPKNGIDYKVTAMHRNATENKATITLNSVNDNIRFTYRDTLEGARVRFRIKGGHGPYRLYTQHVKEGITFDIEGNVLVEGDTVFDKEYLARSFALSEEGDYKFLLVDAESLKKTGSGLVHIVPPPLIPPLVWYIAAGAAGVFLIGYLFYQREKRRKDEELQKLLESRGGSDPKVKRKPKPELQGFWKETAISDLSLHKTFIREISTYLKERPHFKSDKPMIEGVLLGTVLKFDFENEQYEVRLDRFRALTPRPLDYYEDSGDHEKWAEIREVAQDHRDLVKIGWLQVAEGRPMRLSTLEQQFQDEQFSELFQLMLKIDHVEGKKLCGFFTRTTSGKINDINDRQDGVDYWLNWDELEDAGYYESNARHVRDSGESKIKVRIKGQETA